MRRRDFIIALGGAAGALWPRGARAHQSPAIGFFHGGLADGYAKEVAGFKEGLRETGYVEGQNVAIEYRWANGHYEQLSDLAADLVRKRVAVIAAGTISAALAAKNVTQAMPIVFEMGADPVSFGLVASLNRPGGNITGVVNLAAGLVAKRIELMHQLVSSATSIALLVNPGVIRALAENIPDQRSDEGPTSSTFRMLDDENSPITVQRCRQVCQVAQRTKLGGSLRTQSHAQGQPGAGRGGIS
jgi:ABC-type uncharacterized transport system substrate-binding protein